MDYCGPFVARASQLRRAAHVKTYLCIFICFTTKAVHLEVAQDLSTDCFLDVLQRFISRRGAPLHLYSDCGTNFVGASRRLQAEIQKLVCEEPDAGRFRSYTHSKGIQFHFNPPAAPHQGGLWERMVRSTKHHLTRVLGGYVPTVLEFTSLAIRVEAILNSRPLTPLSNDPADCQALTPAHFLIGRPLTAPPTPDINTHPNLVKHSQRLAAFVNGFWSQWRKEYLPTLQPRQKWTKDVPNLQIHDLVVVEEAHAPPLTWPLGRVEEVFAGDDGIVRSVRVRTLTGSYIRPSVKVFRLPPSE
jgi:transposase InsO family protein